LHGVFQGEAAEKNPRPHYDEHLDATTLIGIGVPHRGLPSSIEAYQRNGARVTPGDPFPDAPLRTTDIDLNRSALPATEQVLAGFCHDLNGQLASALGFVYLLAPTGVSVGPLAHLRSSLDQIEVLLRQLRGMVRDDQRSADPTSLIDLLDAAGGLVRQHPRFLSATIHIDGPNDLPAVRIDFASGLRVLLLAIDAAVAGEAVSRIDLGVEARTERVRITIGPRGTGLQGAAEPLVREAREAQVALGRDPTTGEVWLEIPKLT
jgi:hypothetical protein